MAKMRANMLAWLCVGLGWAVGMQADAAGPRPAYSIQKNRVLAAILAAHPELPLLTSDSLSLAAPVEARVQDPALAAGPLQGVLPQPLLQVVGRGGSVGRVEIRCATASECIPFLAWVRLPEGFSLPDSQADLPVTGVAAKGARSAAGRVIEMRAVANASLKRMDAGELPSLHHGERVRLLLDSGLLHLSLPAICMQDGSIGASVRVRTARGAREYVGVVVSATTVRGAL
jgi:hypothetical protein